MKHALRNTLLTLAAIVAALALLEGLARIAKTVDDDLSTRGKQDWLVFSPELGWSPRPGFKGEALAEYREFDENGRPVSTKAPLAPGKRILILGDSVAYGFRVSADSTYAAILESLLDSVRVVNAAVPGYTSYQGRTTLETAIDDEPDLVIVSFNFNDRRLVLDETSQDGPEQFRTIHRWSKFGFLTRYYTFRMLRTVLRRVLGRGVPQIDLRSATVRVPIASYYANLEDIVSLCRSHGVPLLFLVLGDNPDFGALSKRGRQCANDGLVGQAIDSYRRSITTKCFADLSRLELSRIYESVGEPERAARTATVAPSIELPGGSPLRFDDEYCDAMRDVAAKHRVQALDGREVLYNDPSVFFDSVHFDSEGHRKIATLLHEFIVTNELLSGAAK